MGTYTLSIVGESHYQGAIWHCRKGDRVILIRETKNPHDENAVAVFWGRRRADWLSATG